MSRKNYDTYLEEIKDSYQKSKDWLSVVNNALWELEQESNEAFIDYVEETYKTKVKDAKHLQELTGIFKHDTWDEKTQNYKTPATEQEAKNNAIELLEHTLINSKYSKYWYVLASAINNGAKYKDLLKIKPQQFGLPSKWSLCTSSDQYTTILWVMAVEFNIIEKSINLYPDLRSIAQEMEAPYSVLMDAYKLIE